MSVNQGIEGVSGNVDPAAMLGGLHQSLGNGLGRLLGNRVLGGEVVEVFSTRNGKDVELIQDGTGQFVRRTYHREAVREIEQADVSFAEAWQGFNAMFEGAGLNLVPSVLVDADADEPVIVTEYLGDLSGNTVSALPKEAKVTLASNLGKLLTSSPDFLPSAQGFSPHDAFSIHPQTGELCLVDVDPYMHPRRFPIMGTRYEKSRAEGVIGAFMKKIGFNIREWAQTDDERTAMARAFVRTSGEALEDDSSMELIDNFSYVHFMSQGLDPEILKFR